MGGKGDGRREKVRTRGRRFINGPGLPTGSLRHLCPAQLRDWSDSKFRLSHWAKAIVWQNMDCKLPVSVRVHRHSNSLDNRDWERRRPNRECQIQVSTKDNRNRFISLILEVLPTTGEVETLLFNDDDFTTPYIQVMDGTRQNLTRLAVLWSTAVGSCMHNAFSYSTQVETRTTSGIKFHYLAQTITKYINMLHSSKATSSKQMP